jgi:hypothetical protein
LRNAPAHAGNFPEFSYVATHAQMLPAGTIPGAIENETRPVVVDEADNCCVCSYDR